MYMYCVCLNFASPVNCGDLTRPKILERDVWGAVKSQKPKRPNDSNGYCWPSLGLGNPARADILGEDVRGALKSSITCCLYDCNGYCWPSLGLGNTAIADNLGRDVWGALQIEQYVLGS